LVSAIQKASKRAGELGYGNSYSDLKLFIYRLIEEARRIIMAGANR
jgi:hypothetical protein